MKQTSKFFQRLAAPALILGVTLLAYSPITRAQDCGYGTWQSCQDGGKNATPPPPPPRGSGDPAGDPVPEPGTLAQLGAGLAGIAALAILARKRHLAEKA
jgi:PEP-CTERM motif